MSLVPAVTELILAELLYLQYDNPSRPVYMYINSAGVTVSVRPVVVTGSDAAHDCDNDVVRNSSAMPCYSMAAFTSAAPVQKHPSDIQTQATSHAKASSSAAALQKGGEKLGYESEAFAIYDTMKYIKPSVRTLCVGTAFGESAMLLAAGEKVQQSLPAMHIRTHA